jgi:hypothetical protein
VSSKYFSEYWIWPMSTTTTSRSTLLQNDKPRKIQSKIPKHPRKSRSNLNKIRFAEERFEGNSRNYRKDLGSRRRTNLGAQRSGGCGRCGEKKSRGGALGGGGSVFKREWRGLG